MSAFDALPALGPRVRTIAIVPARDEAGHIARTLAALANQRTRDGRSLDPETYETIVFANACDDATAAIARAFAARHPASTIHVVEARHEPGAHVGTARRRLMDAALARFADARRPNGWIASTDADSVVASDWLDALDAEALAGADAVMGRVGIAPAERSAFGVEAALLYGRHLAYNRAVSRLEAAIDAMAWDPAPRHNMQYAASLAVRADVYARVGGLPELPRGEDTAFYSALVGIDARVRHSLRFRVATSPRSVGRVEGGFATFVGHLHGANGPEQWLVEHPEATLHHVRARAALRRYHAEGDARAAAYRRTLESYELDFSGFAALYDASATFGANLHRFETDASERGVFARYGRVPVARAIAFFRAFSAAPSRSAMRTSVASGAG